MTARLYGAACCGLLLALACAPTSAQVPSDPLISEHWFEARTAHFHTYSCGATQEVARLTARLEQFREAYSLLAGTQAVASPPIVVIAFPDIASMRPYLPLYQGRPANLTAFFHRASDENLIVLPLFGLGSLEAVYHEYTHLLLRRNDPYWPLWLKEGMAEIYATFSVTGPHTVRIGQQMDRHIGWLEGRSWLPLSDLLQAGRDSPEYNERERQGIFYSQSWLLAHYLMLGDNPTLQARFGQLTALLRYGESPVQAFTNAFKMSLPAMESALHRYFERGRFNSRDLNVPADLTAPRSMATRPLSTAEVCFRLGDELFRIGRFELAREYFLETQRLAPRSPLSYEGLGLLAAERDRHDEALRLLSDALERGSTSFLAHYIYAVERLQSMNGTARPVSEIADAQEEIRTQLRKSLELMPDFGPAHHLLGVFEVEQDPASAERHLRQAVQLEPENESYLLSLGKAQQIRGDTAAAQRTLEMLLKPYVDAKLRAAAENMLKEVRP